MGVGCWGQGQERQGKFTLTKGEIIMIDSMPRVREAGVVWMSAWEGESGGGGSLQLCYSIALSASGRCEYRVGDLQRSAADSLRR